MKCPYCKGSDLSVIDSRECEELNSIRRRRECLGCNKRFTTYEKIELLDINVKKKDGRTEPFDSTKIKKGILKSIEKRNISEKDVDEIVEDIESKLRARQSNIIPSVDIGEMVISRLKKLDKVAYIRFASVYKEFDDLETFKSELHNLIKGGKNGG